MIQCGLGFAAVKQAASLSSGTGNSLDLISFIVFFCLLILKFYDY